MDIPEHLRDGLGEERVGRIQLAFQIAMLQLGPGNRPEMRELLAESVVSESRDPERNVIEMAARAVARIRSQVG